MENYTLYQTLCCNIPNKEPTLAQKKELLSATDNLYKHQKIQMVRLIIEHFRVNNKENYDIDHIPYEGTQIDGQLQFNLNVLPTELKWILIGFLKVCTGVSH